MLDSDNTVNKFKETVEVSPSKALAYSEDSTTLEAELNLILNSINQGIRIINRGFNILHINEAFARLSGVSTEEAIGKKCWQVFTGPFCNTPQCRLRRIMGGEQTIQEEIIRQKKDDTTVPCVVTAAPLKAPDGELIGIIETFEDITERIQFERNIEESEKQYAITNECYKAVIQGAMEGFFLENLNGDILDVNDAFCSMLGYSRRELLSMNIRDIDVGIMEHPERFEQKTNATREAGGALIEVRHRRKDGTIIDVLVSIKYLDIDEGFFFCFHRDITERKKIYQKLKESEDRYRSLIDLGTNIGEAVIMLQDIDGREGIQTFVSDQWPIITGYSKEELLGMSFFDLVNPRDRRFSLERHRKKVSGESIPNLFEITITRRDGVEAPVEITSARSLYNNQPVNVVYIRDITQRKQAEKEIKQYQEHLEDLVKARTAELQKQIEQRTEFTRALVHEIKTPLASVLVAGELLSSELREEPLRSLSKHLYDGAEELNVRIDELLDLAKGEIGTLKLKYTIVDLQKVLRELNNWLELQVYKKKQHLVLNIAPSLPPLRADEKRLKQILLNLLDNALKFTPEGGIITLRVFEKNSNIVFEIKDTGSGMTEDEQKNIFQAYYRVERDRDRFSGLGLGLALSKTLVELHKGRIWVNSRKNKGSTFSFSLPPAG